MRTLEHVLFSFLFAGENSMRGIEHVLFFFFIRGRKFYAWFPFFTFFPFFCEKKKDFKIGFLKGDIYIYIIH